MELLAPGGTLNCVKTAVNSGADAVYFAGKSFGARSYAGNLSDEEVLYATDYCHLRGAKAYITVNTLTFDREFSELEKFVKTLTKAGVDGVIVQDLGVLRFIREISPDIALHGSTQMTVHSASGVRSLFERGVSRVVLSRELSGKEIEEITKSVDAEIEVFVHGAMCMSYSGQCLMSSVIGGRSGNRGKCAQPCRLTFSADGKNPKHYLSLKDMSYANHIKELMDIGVASLKIEGRMKGEEYISAVVSTYRRLIDEKRNINQDEWEKLNRVFFRGGLSDGYYTGDKGKQMFAFQKPDNPYLKQEDHIIIPDEKQTDIDISAKIIVGEKPVITLKQGEYSASVTGDDEIQEASKKAATVDDVKARLSKLGGTPFKAKNVLVELSDNAFVPVSALNELRRCAVSSLEEEILKECKNKRFESISFSRERGNRETGYVCSVLNMEQYRTIKDYDFKRIYVPLHIVESNKEELDKERVVITPPVILKGNQRKAYKERMKALKDYGFKMAEVMTVDGISICDRFLMYGSQRLNIGNSFSAEEFSELGLCGICLSTELNIPQIRDIDGNTELEFVGYGKIPLMITENCILKNLDMCKCEGMGKMTDRTGAEFTIIKDGDICRSVVLNNLPVFAADKKEDLKRANVDCIRLIFTDEDVSECKRICDGYLKGEEIALKEYTRLQLFKGALL